MLIASSTSALGQVSQGNAAVRGEKDAKIESAKRDLLTTAAVEKVARVSLSEKAADKIVGNRLTEFNPFAVSPTGASSDTVRLDPYLPPPRGFVLLRIRF